MPPRTQVNVASGMLGADAKVLVIAVARIGDTLLITPALRALKQAAPHGTLTCMAHPKRLDVLQHLPFIDRLQGITKHRAIWRGHLRGERFDYAFVYGHDIALLQFAHRVARHVIAFEQRTPKETRRLFRAVPAPTESVHAVTERLLLPQAAGVPPAGLRLAYDVIESERDWARGKIREATSEKAVRIGLQLMSFPTKAYRDWPLGHYIALAERIESRVANCHFVLFGDKRGYPSAEAFRAHFPGKTTNVAGALSLRQSAALMSEMHLYIGIDTGPSHIAGALGIPMVVMYHWRHPGKFLAPLEHPAPLAVIEHPAPNVVEDMSAIGVEEVWSKVEPILRHGQPERSPVGRATTP